MAVNPVLHFLHQIRASDQAREAPDAELVARFVASRYEAIDASFYKAPEGGQDTGANPTDRANRASNHHVLTDAQGIPLNATVTAANVNEVTQLAPSI